MSDIMLKAWDAYWEKEDRTDGALKRVVAMVIEECAKEADRRAAMCSAAVGANDEGSPGQLAEKYAQREAESIGYRIRSLL